MKRICLFAGYNSDGIVEEYVFDYLKELSTYADIFYMAEGPVPSSMDIDKLLNCCKNIYFIDHGKYDFGSYSELAKKYVGWDIIEEYDELIFANDSCFCVQEFKKVFKTMEAYRCDVWGLLATDERNYQYYYTLEDYLNIPSSKVPYFCIGTYFIVFRNVVVKDEKFRKFINSVRKETDRHQVCMKYEIGLTRFLKKNRYKISLFIDVVYRNVIIYNEQGIRLLKRGFPLVKVKTFKENPLSVSNLHTLRMLIKSYTHNEKIDKYLSAINISDNKVEQYRKDRKDAWVPPLLKKSKKEILKLILPPILITKYKEIVYRSNNNGSHDVALLKKYNCDYRRPNGEYIIHFNVAVDTIGGGMLSINRFIDKTIALFKNTNMNILLSGLPLNNPVVTYSMFEPRLQMYHFSDIVAATHPEKLILHIPEFYLPGFINDLNVMQKQWLLSIPYLHINIMDQNHEYFPDRGYIEHCKVYTDKVTISTAHTEYTSDEVAEEVDCPIKLLTPFLPEFYRIPFGEKEKIIAVSHDEFMFDGESKKEETLKYLIEKLRDYEIIVIDNMSLEEYKQLISKALFTITFGEGYDGYFIEPFLSDSIAFAVYNSMFFPGQFKYAPTVYNSWNEFIDNIVDNIIELNENEELYNKYSTITEDMIREVTNDDISIMNLKEFYDDKYDYVPEVCKRTGFYK